MNLNSELRALLAVWDHSATCHPTQVNTPLLKHRYADNFLMRRDRKLSWPRWLVSYRDTEIVYLSAISHPSKYSNAQNPLHTFPRNFPLHGEVANLLQLR